MEFLVYGPDQPRPSFTQSGDQSVSIEFEGDYILELGRLDEAEYSTITWHTLALWGISESKRRDIFRSFSFNETGIAMPTAVLIPPSRVGNPDDSVDLVKMFWVLVDHLCSLLDSDIEREFLRLYAKRCVQRATDSFDDKVNPTSLWFSPALIPQVWVNWIDYDPDDRSRATRARKQPFRVDFLLKHEPASENLIVLEIDGLSHFSRSDEDAIGETTLRASMDQYTKHLKQDRWLRRKGYNVFRFSNKEVHSIAESDNPLRKLHLLLRKNIRGLSEVSALRRKHREPS